MKYMKSRSSMVKYYILAALSRKEMHGYELIMQIEKITGKRPSAGQVYPVLRQLNAAGYIKYRAHAAGKKKIKSYRITSSGERLFSEMSKRFAALIESAIREKIKVCAHCECEIISGAYRKKGLNFCCRSCAASYSKLQ